MALSVRRWPTARSGHAGAPGVRRRPAASPAASPPHAQLTRATAKDRWTVRCRRGADLGPARLLGVLTLYGRPRLDGLETDEPRLEVLRPPAAPSCAVRTTDDAPTEGFMRWNVPGTRDRGDAARRSTTAPSPWLLRDSLDGPGPPGPHLTARRAGAEPPIAAHIGPSDVATRVRRAPGHPEFESDGEDLTLASGSAGWPRRRGLRRRGLCSYRSGRLLQLPADSET